jgi:hypothetical protein
VVWHGYVLRLTAAPKSKTDKQPILARTTAGSQSRPLLGAISSTSCSGGYTIRIP